MTGVDPTASHTLEMRLAYVDGQNNDVINVYLDGQYIGQTTTFENYHDGINPDHIANAQANLTDRVIFRESNNGQPEDGSGTGHNQGFYFDNLTTSVYNNTSGTGNGLANVITGIVGGLIAVLAVMYVLARVAHQPRTTSRDEAPTLQDVSLPDDDSD